MKCHHWTRAILVGLALLTAGCEPEKPAETAPPAGDLTAVRARNELVVLTRNAPTTYYIDRDGRPAGLEADLTKAFAEHLGVTVRYKVLDSLEEILVALAEGKGDLAAAGLTRTETRQDRFLNSISYQMVRQQVVCRRDGQRPSDLEALIGVQMAVVAHSSYVDQLRQLQSEYTQLDWRALEGTDTEKLLEMVCREEIDCTVADSNIVAVNRRYRPELVASFDLTAPEPLVWYLPSGAADLLQEANWFLEEFRETKRLAKLLERYYGFVKIFDYLNIRRYLARIDSRLPKYRSLFEAAGQKNGIDWTLLAAQGYQESYWNRLARSPTGVRGIMMLTLITARELGVKNRLDPEQSIMGGARYLRKLRNRLPEEIGEPDRTWFALAAYNVGYGHLMDARGLARKLGKNPSTWNDLKTVLPLLSQKEHYRKLKYGYARGEEPVRYVTRIRNFHDLLLRQLAAGEKTEAVGI